MTPRGRYRRIPEPTRYRPAEPYIVRKRADIAPRGDIGAFPQPSDIAPRSHISSQNKPISPLGCDIRAVQTWFACAFPRTLFCCQEVDIGADMAFHDALSRPSQIDCNVVLGNPKPQTLAISTPNLFLAQSSKPQVCSVRCWELLTANLQRIDLAEHSEVGQGSVPSPANQRWAQFGFRTSNYEPLNLRSGPCTNEQANS
jgi:hypothetical protein